MPLQASDLLPSRRGIPLDYLTDVLAELAGSLGGSERTSADRRWRLPRSFRVRLSSPRVILAGPAMLLRVGSMAMRTMSRVNPPTAAVLSRAVIAGFVATGLHGARARRRVLPGSRRLARSQADSSGQWLWGLTHNSLVSMSVGLPYVAMGVQLSVGLAFALAYALFLEPGPFRVRAGRGAPDSPSSRGFCPSWSCSLCSAGGSWASNSATDRCRSSGT